MFYKLFLGDFIAIRYVGKIVSSNITNLQPIYESEIYGVKHIVTMKKESVRLLRLQKKGKTFLDI